VLLFTLLSTPRFRGRGQQMNTLYPKIIVAHYKSIGVSRSKSHISIQRGSNNHKLQKIKRNCLCV
jgi:hypothetical protein